VAAGHQRRQFRSYHCRGLLHATRHQLGGIFLCCISKELPPTTCCLCTLRTGSENHASASTNNPPSCVE
jgi:hypothetical protein